MAEIAMTEQRLEAGRDYVVALAKHGMPINFAMWARKDGEFQLMIGTPFVDFAGPTKVYDALFKAYELAKTPRDIDPWIVTLFSEHAAFAKAARNAFKFEIKGHSFVTEDGRVEPFPDGFMSVALTILDWHIDERWVFKRPQVQKRAKPADRIRSWERFESAVAA